MADEDWIAKYVAEKGKDPANVDQLKAFVNNKGEALPFTKAKSLFEEYRISVATSFPAATSVFVPARAREPVPTTSGDRAECDHTPNTAAYPKENHRDLEALARRCGVAVVQEVAQPLPEIPEHPSAKEIIFRDCDGTFCYFCVKGNELYEQIDDSTPEKVIDICLASYPKEIHHDLEALAHCCGVAVVEDVAQPLPDVPEHPNDVTEEQLLAWKAKYIDTESLRAALVSGDTILLSGSWLLGHMRPLPKRQELPDGSWWEAAALLGKPRAPPECPVQLNSLDVPFVALSYCWATPGHPDPTGEQAQHVRTATSLMLKNMCEDIALFLDWCSLYQGPTRTDTEQESFKRALKDVNLWYAHCLTYVWLLTMVPKGVKPYKKRGWPRFEKVGCKP